MIHVLAGAARNINIVMESSNKHSLFISNLKSIYQNKASEILLSISKPRYITFRINKLSESHLRADAFSDLPVKQGLFESFSIPYEHKSMLTEIGTEHEGSIYIQSLSSMVPVYELDPKPGEDILDLCAAPGSKTSLIADLTQDMARITAVENNGARLHAMRANMALLNVRNVEYVRRNASLIGKDPTFISKFDKVLADVPCSNEGLIRDVEHYDFSKWNPKLSHHLPKLQKKILASGLSALKPGGTLVYSTCTYSLEENELVVNWALKKFPDVYLADLSTKLENSTPGFTVWKKKVLDASLSKSMRILPNDLFDGFYVAKFVKS